MKVCVVGLWHLGTVTAACLAKAGHSVVGLDDDVRSVDALSQGRPPLFEPGLEELVKKGLAERKLRFTTDVTDALVDAELVWVAFDTPVDEEDRADVPFVEKRVESLFPLLRDRTVVLTSSQVPVGTTRKLEERFRRAFPGKSASFAYSPENLRLGKAIAVFTEPDRVVVGVRDQRSRDLIGEILHPFTERIEWMSVESAEMTKHALNSFLAVSVTFMNEIATLCERVGADAKEVERGLKSEARIGPRAYLGPGSAIAGGTLARDICFLSEIGRDTGVSTTLISAVRASNDAHKNWAGRKLRDRLHELKGAKISVLGLTYKPGTDTLRRSGSVELCVWLFQQGAHVWAHDPAVKSLPAELIRIIRLSDSVENLMADSEALVVATEWPDYRRITGDVVVKWMHRPVVIDPNRFLFANLGQDPRIAYDAVGMPS